MIIIDEVAVPPAPIPFERMFCFLSKLIFSYPKDATLELRVRTVKYFKDMWQVFG